MHLQMQAVDSSPLLALNLWETPQRNPRRSSWGTVPQDSYVLNINNILGAGSLEIPVFFWVCL